MTKVLITGGTGMIGKPLSAMLHDAGYEVVLLSRNPRKNDRFSSFHWDPLAGKIDEQALQGVESIIHLAGAGITDQPWTAEGKKIILESRVQSANLLLDTCQKQKVELNHFISASAIGWYPLTISDTVHDEQSPSGDGFLAEVCKAWEDAADAFEGSAKHVSKIRIGLVLSKGEGALKEISKPVQYYAAAGLGKGTQSMSWIHRLDVCRIFLHVLENDLEGVYNAVGPEMVNNKDFMQILADVMEKPLLLPNIPPFAIKVFFGEKADLVLKGVPLTSEKIQRTGFSFDFPTLNSALMQVYSNI